MYEFTVLRQSRKSAFQEPATHHYRYPSSHDILDTNMVGLRGYAHTLFDLSRWHQKPVSPEPGGHLAGSPSLVSAEGLGRDLLELLDSCRCNSNGSGTCP